MAEVFVTSVLSILLKFLSGRIFILVFLGSATRILNLFEEKITLNEEINYYSLSTGEIIFFSRV